MFSFLIDLSRDIIDGLLLKFFFLSVYFLFLLNWLFWSFILDIFPKCLIIFSCLSIFLKGGTEKLVGSSGWTWLLLQGRGVPPVVQDG